MTEPVVPPIVEPVVPPVVTPPVAPIVSDEKKFTQGDVDALIGKVRGEGKQKGTQERDAALLAALKKKGLSFETVDELIEHAAQAPLKEKSAEEKALALEKRLQSANQAREAAEQVLFYREMKDAIMTEAGKLGVMPKEFATVWAVLQSDETAFAKLIAGYTDEKGFVGLKESIEALVKEHPAWIAIKSNSPRIGSPIPGARGVAPHGSGQPAIDRNPIKVRL